VDDRYESTMSNLALEAPRSCWALNDTRQRARSEDHVKMQRPRTRGATAAGEMKRRAMQQSSRRQTTMMARQFIAGHCANAPIPAATPLNAASSVPSAPHSLPPVLLPPKTSSPSHGSLCFLHCRRIFELGGEAPRAPLGSRTKTKVPALWAPRAGGPLRIGAPTQGAENHVAPGTSMALTLRGPAPGGALIMGAFRERKL
jgi:hypothetical protein